MPDGYRVDPLVNSAAEGPGDSLVGPMARVSLFLIRVYQHTLSPVFGAAGGCRYTPTCSQYGYEAIQKYGFFKGWRLAVARVEIDPNGKIVIILSDGIIPGTTTPLEVWKAKQNARPA